MYEMWNNDGGVTGYKSCPKTHDGLTPIKIGGFDVHLAGRHLVAPAILDVKDLLVVSLTGSEPNNMFVGQVIQFMNLSLKDHGGVPENWAAIVNILAEAIKTGTKILTYCIGSHGRTGCLAASLIAVMEPDIEDPVAEIRLRHCTKAVESKAQAVAVFALKGQALPQKYEDEFKAKVYTYVAQGGNSVGYSTYSPKPEADGKSKDGLYYHHAKCKCVADCTKTAYMPKPCECGHPACLWNGVPPKQTPLLSAGANGDSYRHHFECPCGKCSNVDYYKPFRCECGQYPSCNGAAIVVVKEKEQHAVVNDYCVTCGFHYCKCAANTDVPISKAGHPKSCICDDCLDAEALRHQFAVGSIQ